MVVHTSLLTESFLVDDADGSGDTAFSSHFTEIRWDDLENEESAQMLWKIADDVKRRPSGTGNLSLRNASSVPASERVCEDSSTSIWRINVQVSSDLLLDFLVHSRTLTDWI